MLFQVLYSFVATFCFGILFNIKNRKLIFTSMAGSLSWVAFLSIKELGYNETLAYFIAAVLLSTFSEIGARYLRTPVTSILICGLIPLVPGGGMYYTMYYIIQKDSFHAFNKGISTMFAAGSLAIGIIVVTTVVKMIKTSNR